MLFNCEIFSLAFVLVSTCVKGRPTTTTTMAKVNVQDFFAQLNSKDLIQNFDENFENDAGQTWEQKMFAGQEPDQWKNSANELGIVLAKLSKNGAKNKLDTSASGNFNAPSALQGWLNAMNVKEILPEQLREAYGEEHLQQRAEQAKELMKQGNFVCFQNILLKNIKLAPLKINANNFQIRFGPKALDSATFLADILLMYYKQMGVVEHGVQFKTTETAQTFGNAFDAQSKQNGVSEEDVKNFWADVSLLAGWEIVRRLTDKDNVDAIFQRPDHDFGSVLESGLRLINNERIKSPVFLVNVALSML